MAITWSVKITVTNIEKKEASIVATRTDDEAPVGQQINTYAIPWTEIATQQQRVDTMNRIWAMHEEKLAKDVLVNGIIDGLEGQAEIFLQNKE